MRIWGIAVALLLGWAATVQAEPLNLKQIPADAQWLAHVDVDAIRNSAVAQKIHEQCMAKVKDAKEHLDKARERIGMDPRVDLHGVTLYGTKICGHDGALIVHAKVDKELLLKKAEKAPQHEVTEYNDFQIHTWLAKKGKHEHKAAGAFFKDDVLVFGSSVDNVKKALDVLKGDAPSLDGKTDSPLAAAVPAGASVVARAVDISQAEAICKSPLVKKSKQFSFAKGENEGKAFMEASLVTSDKETAEQLQQIVEGARAMVLLKHGSDEGIKKLIDQVKVCAKDGTVSLKFEAATEDITSQLGKICDHISKMKEKHKEMMKERKEKMKERKEKKLEKQDL